jgi:hypothetical protein
VSGNTLTVVSTIAGIAVGFVTSLWLARSGKRHAETQREKIEKDFADLQSSFSAQQSILAGVAEIIRTKPAMADFEVSQTPQLAPLADKAGADVVTPPRSAASSSAIDVLVRASLGALLNEHGEVSVPRLLQELARALPGAAQSSVLSSLEELRSSGRVSWSGGDVRKAGVIKVHP